MGILFDKEKKIFKLDTEHTTYMAGLSDEGYVGHARDKDAVAAVMALCEAAAYYKEQGITLCEQMENRFQTYGYYKEELCTVTLKGQEGEERIRGIMENIRKNIPDTVGSRRVYAFRDYAAGTIKNLEDGSVTETGLPRSNVLYFEFDRDAWCCVRPSGTEPKIKFYVGVRGTDAEDAGRQLEELMQAVTGLAD